MPAQNLSMLYPQLALTVGILVVLILGILSKSVNHLPGRILGTGLGVFLLAAGLSIWFTESGQVVDQLKFDAFAKFFLIFALVAGAIALITAFKSDEISGYRFPEYTALLISICLGISMMAAAQSLFIAYLAMEMVSLSSYVLTGFKKNCPASHEAALKYVIYGGVASGTMLFGISLLYGFTGTTAFSGIATALSQSDTAIANGPIGLFALILALVFVFAGFCFKIAAVPFHMWCPDVYQGAPTPFTGFLSVAPKAAGFALLLRFLANLFPHATLPIQQSVLAILGLVSAVTMTLGNFSALHQTNLKRMLAYSSIAHAGYLLMGLVVLDLIGSTAVLVYLVIYMFMNLGAFFVVQIVAHHLGSEELATYRGLGYRSPYLAICFGIFLFSLAGMPPLAGFIGKFYLFAAVIEARGFWYLLLAVVGILNSVIALFYYTLILREMFFRKSDTSTPLRLGLVNIALITVLALPVFGLGLYWTPLVQVVTWAAGALGLS